MKLNWRRASVIYLCATLMMADSGTAAATPKASTSAETRLDSKSVHLVSARDKPAKGEMNDSDYGKLRIEVNEKFSIEVATLHRIANVVEMKKRALKENEFKLNPMQVCSTQIAAHKVYMDEWFRNNECGITDNEKAQWYIDSFKNIPTIHDRLESVFKNHPAAGLSVDIVFDEAVRPWAEAQDQVQRDSGLFGGGQNSGMKKFHEMNKDELKRAQKALDRAKNNHAKEESQTAGGYATQHWEHVGRGGGKDSKGKGKNTGKDRGRGRGKGRGNGKNTSNEEWEKNAICHNCGLQGHIKPNCPHPPQRNNTAGSGSSRQLKPNDVAGYMNSMSQADREAFISEVNNNVNSTQATNHLMSAQAQVAHPVGAVMDQAFVDRIAEAVTSRLSLK